MQVNGLTGGGAGQQVVDADKSGFAGLTAESFMKMLLTQLQNQDPMDPVGNDELLSQLAMMRNLQSNIELGDAIKAITSNQQLSTAATFIGKTVTGTTSDQQEVTGVADRAFLRDGRTFVGVGDAELSLTEVSSVSA
jgi:flagellar basal-body rod modification protein FlgD